MEARSIRLGSDEPTERARQIIALVAENIKDKDNRIVIEGHTDAAPFKNAQKTNWELSSLRASAARRELEANGIDSERVARVVGYADKDLFLKEKPRDPETADQHHLAGALRSGWRPRSRCRALPWTGPAIPRPGQQKMPPRSSRFPPNLANLKKCL